MSAKRLAGLMLPVALAVGLSACESQSGVQPGVVNTQPASAQRGETGRVIEIREAQVRSGASGVSDGTLIGGGVGAAGGAAIGAATTNSVGGAVVGGLLGAVGGAIAGTAIDRNSTRRGIIVTVQRDDGQTVNIAQPDNGDIQMGDRVMIVYDRNNVARVVRDTRRRAD